MPWPASHASASHIESLPFFSLPEAVRPVVNGDWWHCGHVSSIDDIDFEHREHGGFHVGTYAQARDRRDSQEGRPKLRRVRVQLDPNRVRIVRDANDVWDKHARKARARGLDALLYLNRYEGITQESFERIEAYTSKMKAKLWDTGLPDRIVRRLAPELGWSLLILNPTPITFAPWRKSPKPATLLAARALEDSLV